MPINPKDWTFAIRDYGDEYWAVVLVPAKDTHLRDFFGDDEWEMIIDLLYDGYTNNCVEMVDSLFQVRKQRHPDLKAHLEAAGLTEGPVALDGIQWMEEEGYLDSDDDFNDTIEHLEEHVDEEEDEEQQQ